jgi:hypothetical protein
MPDVSTQIVINNGWNNLKIWQLKRKLTELKIYRYLHKEAGNYYKKLHQKLFLPQTTIMTISSGTLFVSLSGQISDSNRYWINVFVSFLTLIGTVLSVWIKFFDADNIANTHIESSKNYSIIIEEIEDELSLDFEEKTNYSEFNSKIKRMINDEKKKSLDIDPKFWNKYFESVSKGELVMLNYNILDSEINKELKNNIERDISNVNNSSTGINSENENSTLYIAKNIHSMMNNMDMNNMNNMNNMNGETENETAINFNEIFSKTNIDVLRKNIKYQLERNL